ncbi:DUF3093 domain-containing protein [Brevibacterium album]|uniref:DUF3093 domain-containing protein n=1 Tax=Brevibacterium album TaxID=417948 RepID=UPI000403BD94|nr:DUF3093 domain-containing protein [Brevibacterium album]
MSSTTAVLFSERLHPSAGWSIGAFLLSAMTSLLLIPISPWAGVGLALLVMLAVLAGLVRASARVVVTADTFVAGGAAIERRFITGAQGFDAAGSFAQRGRELDVRAFLMLRPWVRTVVRVDIADPADPTPYWLVSTRRPRELAAALNS